MSVSDYLQKAKALVDELSTAGCPLSIAKFNAIIYRNVNPDYYSVTITALNQYMESISFHELRVQLVAHEVLLQSLLQSPNANLAQKNALLLLRPTTPPALWPYYSSSSR